MRRTTVLVTMLLLVTAFASGPAVGAARPAPAGPAAGAAPARTTTADGNDTETGRTGPGVWIAGAVDTAGAAVEGEVASRTFDARLDGASSNDSRAAVIGTQFDESRARIAAIERERARLRSAYVNGTIGEGAYHARMASLDAELRATARLVEHGRNAVKGVPPGLRRRAGLDRAGAELDERVDALRSDDRSAPGRSGRPGTGRGHGNGTGPAAGPPRTRGGSDDGRGVNGHGRTAGATNPGRGTGPNVGSGNGGNRFDDARGDGGRRRNATPAGNASRNGHGATNDHGGGVAHGDSDEKTTENGRRHARGSNRGHGPAPAGPGNETHAPGAREGGR